MKRLGKIKISELFLKDENIEDLIPVFNKFIPIHIEHRPHYRDYIYTVYCKDFDELDNNIEIPFYICEITNGNKVKFIKQ